jgi:rhodanese-related sulfurtransferase
MTAAQGFQTGAPSYAGDVSAEEAWKGLSGHRGAQLVDVRTEAEWTFVGVPDLSELSRQPLLLEWQRFPGGAPNRDFAAEAAAALDKAGYAKGAPIYFLCRSGARSRAAAVAMTAAGYGPCFNIREGFEGGLDDERRRGRSAGWKVAGLPWVQS